MAITDIKLSGKVFTDAGTAVNGATVALLETGSSTEEASTTTNSSGEWAFTETSLDTTYDIKISVGSSVRYILWSDEITATSIDAASMKIRGTEGAVAPLYFFADQADDAGDAWRIQASASDTLAIGSDKASAGTIIDYITITNGANAAASTVAIGGALTAVTVDASTDFTVGDTVITDGVITDSSGLQLAANLDINGTADISGDLTLSAGADGALRFSVASSIKILDNSATALVIEEADNAYMTFVTTNSSEAITIAKATTFSAGIADSGTIAAGTWNGTAIATGYIAGDAITGAKIADDAIDSEHYTDGSIDTAHLAADVITGAKVADDAIDSEHYTDGSIDTAHLAADAITGAKIADDAIDSEHYTDGSIDNAHIADDAIDSEHYAAASIDFAHIQNVAANSILGRDANSSGVLSEVALATTQILIGDGTGFTPAALSGDATMTNAGVVSLAAAQTNVTSLLATDIKIGEDDQTKIDFEDANTINFYANNDERMRIDSDGKVLIGHTAAITLDNGFIAPLQISGTALSHTGLSVVHYSNDAVGGQMRMASSRGAAGVNTVVQDGDELGVIRFNGADGSGVFDTSGAMISAHVDGTPGSNDMPGRLAFWTSPDGSADLAERMRINNTGIAFIGDTAVSGSYMDAPGLVINQGAGNLDVLEFKNSDVSHGRVSVGEIDTFAAFRTSNTTGGLLMSAIAQHDSTEPTLFVKAFGGTPNTDKDETSQALIQFTARQHNASDAQANIDADGNVFAIRARVGGGDKTRFMVDEDGQIHAVLNAASGDIAVGAMDAYEDAQLVRAIDHARNPNGMIKTEWDDFVRYNEQDLIDVGVIGDTVENGGLLNVTGLQRLHNGAIWQGYVRQQEMQERIDTLEEKLLAIEGAK